MVFDWVYGRRKAVATNVQRVTLWATANHYTTPFAQCRVQFGLGGELRFGCRRSPGDEALRGWQRLARSVRLAANNISWPFPLKRHEGETGTSLMATSVLWHGSQTEALELLQALSRNCSCVVTAEGVRLSTCAPHDMLASDQRAVDGLLFARRIAARLRAEEFNPHAAQPSVAASS
jgi:hypothetical protein